MARNRTGFSLELKGGLPLSLAPLPCESFLDPKRAVIRPTAPVYGVNDATYLYCGLY